MNGDNEPELFIPSPKGKVIGNILPKGKSPENLGWYSAMYDVTEKHRSHACNCVGPQDGKPLCPCQMASVKVVDGRYTQTIDHGPAPVSADDLRSLSENLIKFKDGLHLA